MSYDYPELYYRVYPKVMAAVDAELNGRNPINEISNEQMDKMVNDVYYDMVEEYPEIHEDPYERRYRGRVRGEQRIFFGRSRILRDFITVLLISELLRRNQTFFPL